MQHRKRLLAFGASRGMNAYLYAPKDDPYHREKWRDPYPDREWADLVGLIGEASHHGVDFAYGFHPGRGLSFFADEPIGWLLAKAERFYDIGVRLFAVLFDDIPSRLDNPEDQEIFHGSLAEAQGTWMRKILERQPSQWKGVEWWLCPSYYTHDPLLAKTFGAFESRFLETLSCVLPESVACLWTGPLVVSREISLSHASEIRARLRRKIILWDNYPVNDLSMSMELHLSPLTGRDPRLPEEVYGYLNNPLLQESLSLLPLGTCFDYSHDPSGYDPETSWEETACELFGVNALSHWRALRGFFERLASMKEGDAPVRLANEESQALANARHYILQNRAEPWAREISRWMDLMEKSLGRDSFPHMAEPE
jgi:hyaluronoglucosaminidase